MKAIINGITVYGTPEEILEYQMLEQEHRHNKAKEMLVGNMKLVFDRDVLTDIVCE